jgi:hypothetical protein
MTKHLLTLLFSAVVLVSCEEEKQKQVDTTDTNNSELFSIDSNDFYIDESEIDGGNTPREYIYPDTIVFATYPEFSISISRLIVYEDKEKLRNIKNDTTFLTIDLAETLEGQQIEIIPKNLVDITVEQCYQTSLTIYNEGPHCDLLEWRHYTSAWQTLEGKSNIFTANKYTEAERKKFPVVSLDEVKIVAKNYCQGKFFKLIGEIKSINKEKGG